MTQEPSARINSSHELVLPVSKEAFADFVGKLLGKSQSIEARFDGPFDLTVRDIENCFHLVEQRVHRQNAAQLVQFLVRIDYDDNSSVTLNSLDEFLSHREVRPLASEAAHLSWTYLIQFNKGSVPEKQVIDLSTATRRGPRAVVLDPTDILLQGPRGIRPCICSTDFVY